MGLGFGTLIALFVLIAPGAIVGRIAQLTWPVAVAVAAPLTYGVVALAIIPFGAVGIPWNGWTALAAPDWLHPCEGWMRTKYEGKAMAAGRKPVYLTFARD